MTISGTDQEPSMSDADLVEACLEGRPGAWTTLVGRYATLVYSVGRRAGLDAADAEDVAQATFTSLLSAMPVMRDRQSLAKWLITVAQRHAWKAVKARRARTMPEAHLIGESTTTDDDESLDVTTWQRRHAVRQALADLGGRCQELLTALFSENARADYQEVSRQLGIPIGSIGPTRNRCLRKLLAILTSRPGSETLWDDRETEMIRKEGRGDVSERRKADT